jgi:hypothetical protein
MTINSVYFKCDGCGIISQAFEEFTDAVAWIRKNGWASRKVGDKAFTHYCPECKLDQ